MKKKSYLIFGILVLFSLTFISAEIQVGTSGDIGVDLNIPTPINYSTVNVNNSEYWDGLNTPAEIDHDLLNNLEWSNAGHTIDTFINMNEESLMFADLVSANRMSIRDETLNADGILTMYTHDASNSFVLTVTDAGATDFYSGDQYQFRLSLIHI